jgi:hypothetical protein
MGTVLAVARNDARERKSLAKVTVGAEWVITVSTPFKVEEAVVRAPA